MSCVPPNRTTTTPIIAGSGMGTNCTPNVGYHNRRLVGGIYVTDVYNNRISNTITPHRVSKERLQDNLTVTEKLHVVDVEAQQQYASADLTVSPQTLSMINTGSLTIFINDADPGDMIIVNNPFIPDATADISIIEAGVTGVTLQEFNDDLGADIGQAIITMPATTPAASSGYIVLKVN